MISTLPSPWPTETLERLAWPGAAAVVSVVSWVVFLITEDSLILIATLSLLLLLAIYQATNGKKLLLALLIGVLLTHLSFYALYTWPVPNLLILVALLFSLFTVWHSIMGSRFRLIDIAGLLGVSCLTWLVVAYLPSNLVNATTLSSLPLFVLLPAVYHQKWRIGWLVAGFSLCLAAAIVIIQTSVLYSL